MSRQSLTRGVALSLMLLLAAMAAQQPAEPNARSLVSRAIELDRCVLSPPRELPFKFRVENQTIDKRGNVVGRDSRTTRSSLFTPNRSNTGWLATTSP